MSLTRVSCVMGKNVRFRVAVTTVYGRTYKLMTLRCTPCGGMEKIALVQATMTSRVAIQFEMGSRNRDEIGTKDAQSISCEVEMGPPPLDPKKIDRSPQERSDTSSPYSAQALPRHGPPPPAGRLFALNRLRLVLPSRKQLPIDQLMTSFAP